VSPFALMFSQLWIRYPAGTGRRNQDCADVLFGCSKFGTPDAEASGVRLG